MNPIKTFWSRQAGWWMLLWWLVAIGRVPAQNTPFSFVLDEPSTTSAGVYAPDGTLVRTLWSKVPYPAGTSRATWDGLDDSSNPVAPGTYQIKLLQHNTEYVWDGAVGNTSTEPSGPTVHTGYWPMLDMAIAGTNAFYASGYNEGSFDFRRFITTDPQRVTARWGPGGAPANIYDPYWSWTATDGTWVYFACSATYSPVGGAGRGAVLAYNVADNSPAQFTSGGMVTNGSATPYPGIYVGTNPYVAGHYVNGLAVQTSGNLLAVSVLLDNMVYLFDKRAGSLLNQISVTSPGRLGFSPDGSLWIVSGSGVINYTNLNASPAAARTISGFSQPLAVAVNPTNADLVLVADGLGSEQIKAFNHTGSPLWTYGLAGGYQTYGAAVNTNKFWFDDGQGDASTFLAFAPDGSFWVGDGGNHRSLHFLGAGNYLEQIMYQPHSYSANVDQTDPSRVFNQFLEFSVDYSKPLSQAWTLVNNWKADVDAVHLASSFYTVDEGNQGLYEVTTFTNGRTYALINNYTYQYAISELCELTQPVLRLTGITPAYGGNSRGWISLGPDGSARRTTIGLPTWFEDTLQGFDSNNNPLWSPDAPLASASDNSTDPAPRGSSFGNMRATISTNNILISFDPSLNNGWHLGGIRVGGTNWLWKASPAVTTMNGTGNYEIGNGVQYAGNTVQAVDRNVIYGYHGEFFRGAGQADQVMHFYDDGLFVGQFGESDIGHLANEGAVPASAGNAYSPTFVKASGGYYVWLNDESGHGPQRWHLANAGNIREQTGSGSLGSSITLTSPPSVFPTAVTGLCSNQTVVLSWLPVAGATSYNVRYSLLNGGPYTTLATTAPNTSCTVTGLTNGQTYYFVVTAIQGGVEGQPSEQVHLTPFDTTQTVLCAGSMAEGGEDTPVIDVSSAGVGSAQGSYTGDEHLAGTLTLQNLNDFGFGDLQYQSVGSGGYAIFDPLGSASSLIDLTAPLTQTFGPGWYDASNLERQYRVGGVLYQLNGMMPGTSPVCSIYLSPGDTNYHVLTVVSPAQLNPQTFLSSPRLFTMRLTSTNNSSAAFTVNEAYGLTHTFQFLFKGNVTLSSDGTGGGGAYLQAIFLDDAAVAVAPTLPPTNSLGVIHLSLSGSNLLMRGLSGQAGVTFQVLTATNLAQPLALWTPIATNAVDANGNFNFALTNAVIPSQRTRYYILKLQ